jgi:hypothetical protein
MQDWDMEPEQQVQRAVDGGGADGEEVGKSTRSGALRASIPTGGGAPLGAEVRRKMESKLGADLSGVRIHDGGGSATAAKDLGARAFAVGNDLHFGSGQFAPGNREGDRLLAHELTHVVQGQRSGIQRKAEEGAEEEGEEIQRKADGGEDEGEHHKVSQPHEPAEVEADAVADKVADSLHGGGGAEAEEPTPISAKLESVARKAVDSPVVISRAPLGFGKKVAPPGMKEDPAQIKAWKANYKECYAYAYVIVPMLDRAIKQAQAKMKKNPNDAGAAAVLSNLWQEKQSYAAQAAGYKSRLSYFEDKLRKAGEDVSALRDRVTPRIDGNGKVSLESIHALAHSN